jgi:hypothetical protein
MWLSKVKVWSRKETAEGDAQTVSKILPGRKRYRKNGVTRTLRRGAINCQMLRRYWRIRPEKRRMGSLGVGGSHL